MRRAATAVLTLGLLAYGYDATADESRVALSFGGCVALSPEAVQARLAIELPGSTRPGLFAPTQVAVDCAGETVRLTVIDPLTRKTLSRTLTLGEREADVRARVVGIAVAELIAASWLELEGPEARADGPAPPRPAVTQALSSLARRPSSLVAPLRLEAIASTQIFFSGPRALWGGGLRFSDDAFHLFGFSVDLLAHHGGEGTSLGHVAIDTITVGATAVAHRSWRRVTLRGGLGFRIGATVLRGEPPEGSAARAGTVVWAAGGPLASFGVHVVPVRDLFLGASVEGGYSIFPTGGLVDGRREVSVEGPWLGVQLGVGLAL